MSEKPRKIYRNVTIWNLRHNDCRFITHFERGNPDKTTYCGLPAVPGKSYCEEHTKITSAGSAKIEIDV